MKKKLMIFIAVGVVFVSIGGILIFNLNRSINIEKFDLADYQWEIEAFPSDKNIGSIDDASIAIEKSKELWIEKYSTINGQPYNPINERKIEVAFDSDHDCWHVYGTVPPNTLGGVPHSIIRKSGEVLATWIDD